MHAIFSNETILNVNAQYAELSISQINGSVCFIFGFTGDMNEISGVNQAFSRASESLNCNFSEIKSSMSPGLLNTLLSILYR